MKQVSVYNVNGNFYEKKEDAVRAITAGKLNALLCVSRNWTIANTGSQGATSYSSSEISVDKMLEHSEKVIAILRDHKKMLEEE